MGEIDFHLRFKEVGRSWREHDVFTIIRLRLSTIVRNTFYLLYTNSDIR